MGYAHIVVEDLEGNAKARWHTTETYRVTDEVAQQLSTVKPQPIGRDLQDWVVAHGGVLDDANGKAARVSTKNDGTVLNDHYKDGQFTTSDVVHPKGAKNDGRAGAQLFLALLTGGTSLFVTPFIDDNKPGAGDSKFAPGTQPDRPVTATAEAQTAKPRTAAAQTAKPKP